ncbi:sulfurtransferase [Spirochaeta isovalerica]|uniref:Thiosulfate/3-mercaptopyruvate sulfurtransferase n=1 Tax=Spirochaeta isovalerica TaxID=150 RepID=A0A841RBJ5_9SPIO|nr:rhodanese-like domain-containing protein [Spirochaeta isovalerica]MBB6479782.1 thiosulfate/3-mercaptopyruvate sulfurtransferase [Spirochaeta isovalerica]
MGKIRFSTFILIPVLLLAACSFVNYADSGTLIVSASDALKKIESGYIPVDAQRASSYGKEHLVNAVNIERNAIMIKEPVANTLATAEIVARAAGAAGLTENSNIVIYDDNMNMDSSRLWWTLKIYGHKGDIVIVSGGVAALKGEGAVITDAVTAVSEATYRTSPLNSDMLATKEEILRNIDNPSPDFVLIDVRSDEEFNAGTIPGSIHINHEKNMFVNEDKGTTFRPYSHNRILYKELGITPEKEIVMYCKSSVRAANTYAALYDAGYRNLKVYDGAYLEWSAEKLPVIKTEVEVKTTTTQSDNS